MRNLLLALAGVAACAGPAHWQASGEVLLTVEGKVERGPHTFAREDLARLPERGFVASAPGTGKNERFDGVGISAVLGDAIELESDGDTVVFHGAGGRLAAVPIASVRQLRPALAATVDGKPVSAWRDDAAPLQLAWPNLDQPGIDSDPRMRWWWIGGIRRIEVQNWLASYGKALRVPAGAGDEAQLGAEALSQACLGCHRVRGVGGTRGPELTGAVVQRAPAWFEGAMRDHLEAVEGRPIPELGPATGREIAAFLTAVEIAGGRAEEEIKPPEPPPPLPPPTPPRRYP